MKFMKNNLGVKWDDIDKLPEPEPGTGKIEEIDGQTYYVYKNKETW